MKIVYFTTAQDEKDYRSFIKLWKIALNSSNQNFHNKFIRALAINNTVDAISIRPFSRSNSKVRKLEKDEKIDGNITWHYLKRSGNRFLRNLNINPQVKKILGSLDLTDSIFITDTINPSVVSAVEKVAKKYKRPVIGVCTDSPSNISGTRKSYTLYLLSKVREHDGFIALTEGLNSLFNPNGKPHFIFEGIVENDLPEVSQKETRPYFFFGGALMKKYGVYNLIEAFKNLKNPDVDLLICGHHGDKDKLKEAAKGCSNIKFLGLLPVNKVLEYEQQSIACINPRPFSEDLDRFSIPSKTLEYMSSGRPVISVRNTILMNRFPKDVLWINSSEAKDIEEALTQVLEMSEKERTAIGKEIKNRVQELYSIESIGKNIQDFLLQFIK